MYRRENCRAVRHAEAAEVLEGNVEVRLRGKAGE